MPAAVESGAGGNPTQHPAMAHPPIHPTTRAPPHARAAQLLRSCSSRSPVSVNRSSTSSISSV